jgi:ABC-type bacteriocin/lantibiotic exporter with double-glycine peptidase domain
MPRSLFAFLWRVTASNQIAIGVIAAVVFVLNTAPLETQRRILNAAVLDRDAGLVVVLATVYAAIVVLEGLVKLLMNVYGGWIGEKAVRALRLAATRLVDAIPSQQQTPSVRGVEVAMILGEPEAIGGFVGVAIGELVLHAGILFAVFGYMFYVQPTLALVCLAIFSPQLVFVPLMQNAINRRVQARIGMLRHVSTAVLRSGTEDAEKAALQKERFADIFEVNLGVIKLRFTMKFLMNMTHNFGRVLVLCVGGLLIVRGQSDIGTVVAFVSGLGSLRDPWTDLVNWYQEALLTSAKYRMFVAAMVRFGRREDPLATVVADDLGVPS